ncbi:hypothetical protein CAPI_02010 [Corynebacterium capitovis DSM 44611]|uniref:DUF3558 family protein n=1 Tax=Corynebacterium capitovis TaxID=131081 RepID=UPI0014616ED2|nr:hypothetical protein CAPI_02010 [Corynebacterium capitovis DSM 44611]
MKRFGLLLCAVGLLASCGTDDGGDATVTGAASSNIVTTGSVAPPDAEPTAFHFRSGDLVLGPFDPYAVLGNVFDPCAEISVEEFAAAGFTVDPSRGVTSSERGVSSCFVEGSDPYVIAGFGGNAANREVISSKKTLLSGYSSVIPGLFVYGDGRSEDAMCTAAVETPRGSLTSSFGTLRPSESLDTLCAEAVHMLEALFLLNR